jgi:uncharacterized membrane protein
MLLMRGGVGLLVGTLIAFLVIAFGEAKRVFTQTMAAETLIPPGVHQGGRLRKTRY